MVFNDDDNSAADAADARLTQQLEESAGVRTSEEPEGTDRPTSQERYLPGDEPIIMPFEDPPAKEESRDDKKRNRYREAQEAKAAAEEAQRQLMAENAALRAQMTAQAASAQARMSVPQNDPVDEIQQRIDANYQQRRALFDSINSKQNVTDAEREKFLADTKKLEEEHVALGVQKAMRDQAPPAPARGGTALEDYMQLHHGDVLQNAKAKGHALASYAEWTADNPGRTATARDYDSFMEHGRQKAGIATAPPATERERSLHTGGGGRGAAAQGKASSRTGVKMGPVEREMARAAFPHIKDDAKRDRMWASTAGKRHAEWEDSQ